MIKSNPLKIRGLPATVLLFCVCAIAGLCLLTDFGYKKVIAKEDSGLNDAAGAFDENQVSPERLIGGWLRQDGRYIIKIRKINDDGTLDAAYYNPKPINISRTKVSREKATMKIFIELRDKGYPGSTYTLDYISKNDTLTGNYFHAGVKQHFQVIFSRIK